MKTLRSIYLYGLHETARKHDNEVPIGQLLFSISRTKQRTARYRNNNDSSKNDSITDFLTNTHSII